MDSSIIIKSQDLIKFFINDYIKNDAYNIYMYQEIDSKPMIQWFNIWLEKNYSLSYITTYDKKECCVFRKTPIFLFEYCLQYINYDHLANILKDLNISIDDSLNIFTNLNLYNPVISKFDDKFFKKFIANILAEIIINNTSNIDNIDIDYYMSILKSSQAYSYMSSINQNNVYIALCMSALRNHLKKQNIIHVYKVISRFSSYYQYELCDIIKNNIRSLIIKLLNKRKDKEFALEIYKALIPFNVFTDNELIQLHKKEAKFIMNSLFVKNNI